MRPDHDRHTLRPWRPVPSRPVRLWPVPSRSSAGSAMADAGSATVWMLTLIGIVLITGIAALALGQVVMARHRAGAAADLAALAAADHAWDGGPAACEHALAVVRAQRAELVRCGVDGQIADVLVQVAVAVPLAVVPPARARARAGPAEPAAPAQPGAPARPPP